MPMATATELALLQAALADASLRLTRRGETVRYLRSTLLTHQERLLSWFEAASPEAVRKVNEIAGHRSPRFRPRSSSIRNPLQSNLRLRCHAGRSGPGVTADLSS